MLIEKNSSLLPPIDDDAIARQVCKWMLHWRCWYKRMPHWMDDVKTKYVSELMEYSTKWEPQFKTEHAMEIAWALQEQGWRWSISFDGAGYIFTAHKSDGQIITAWHDTMMMAICLAAMQLVEVDK